MSRRSHTSFQSEFDTMNENSTINTPIQLSDKVIEIKLNSGSIDPLLFQLFEQPTPHGHEKLLHDILPFMITAKTGQNIEIDKLGNIIVDVGTPKTDFRSVFSCHMDTVHNALFKDSLLRLKMTTKSKDTTVDKEGLIYASVDIINDKTKKITEAPCVLGGDDKVGVYILCRMIDKGIPGRYIFHVGEERGCIGAKYIATDTPDRLKHMRRAIAFDRAGYTDVIAWQRGSRCSSETFSKELAKALNATGAIPPHSQFVDNVRGVSTDTAEYTHLVSECCNISIGYFNNHGSDEYVDAVWVENMLLPAILNVKWEELPTERDKTAPKTYAYNSNTDNTTYVSAGMLDRSMLREDTPLWQVPEWHPAEGWDHRAGPIGMKKLVAKWLWRTPYREEDQQPRVLAIVDLVADLHNAKLECAHLRKCVTEKHDAPRFKITYRLGFIESLKTTWDKMIKDKVIDTNITGRLLTNPIQMHGLSDEESKLLLKIIHVNSQFKLLDSNELYRIKLGLDIDTKAQIKVNKLFVETVLAISNFVHLNKRLKKQIRTATLHMKHNVDDPVFSRLKEALLKHNEVEQPSKATPVAPAPQPSTHKCAGCKDTGIMRKPMSMPNSTVIVTLVPCPACFPVDKPNVDTHKTTVTTVTAVGSSPVIVPVTNDVSKPTVH